jgi:hypothetical protein
MMPLVAGGDADEDGGGDVAVVEGGALILPLKMTLIAKL